MNQVNVIVSERSSAIILQYLFIFLPQAINALNKQFNLGWKLMNYDFKGDLQTYSTKSQLLSGWLKFTEHQGIIQYT